MKIIRDINSAAAEFKKGKIGVFPTDTVWGVGCILENEKAIRKLYKIKRREKDKPTAVLAADYKQAKRLGEFNKQAEILAQKYWPGGLTIIVPLKKTMRSLAAADNKKIGIRVPKHHQLLKIIAQAGPLVTASANFKGQKTPAKKSEISNLLLKRVDFLFDGLELQGKLASTVVDTATIPFQVLRHGIVAL